MQTYRDQLGRFVSISPTPQRIISLVPSITELLNELQLEKEVVGITKFCVHPEHWFRNKTRVGGTKNLKLDVIESLKPDLIIANKEENRKEQIDALEARFPVWTSDVSDLGSSIAMIKQLASITGRAKQGDVLASEISAQFTGLEKKIVTRPIRTTYLIWQDPLMTVGGDTFINDMMKCCGLENIYAGSVRYPIVSIEELIQKNCELVLLSSEPFRFKETHQRNLERLLPGIRIELVDGEMFSWYGSRLKFAAHYFCELRTKLESTIGV